MEDEVGKEETSKTFNEKRADEDGHIEEVEGFESQAVMLSQSDNLPIIDTMKRYKLITCVALFASFSASLDGYQITLNGGIVSNKGFIQEFFGSDTTVIDGKYVSAWGGIQSAGQFVGQVFLQFATDRLGRKAALYILWIFLTASIFAESFATRWEHWLVAKLFSGMGVGMLQATIPVYLAEISPTQLRGLLINTYTFWFVLGQLSGSIALNGINETRPTDFRLAIYTQWAMVGTMLIIFILLPESPWWLVGQGKTEKAMNVLKKYRGRVDGSSVHEHIQIMAATIEEERHLASQNSQEGLFSVFQGRNAIRFLIASWPKIVQQFVGLSVFNTYATYFFQNAGNANPFQVTVILGCTQLLSMLITASLTDRFGRRPLTVYPYGVTSLSLLALGIVGCFNYKRPDVSALLVFFACLATFTTTGASAIGYAYAAEIPQQRLRARTAGWALAFSNLVAILFSFTTPEMINGGVTQWGVKTGFFFAASGAISVVIAWQIMPEVARRTPAEIDEMFERKVGLRHFKNYVTEIQMTANDSSLREKSNHES